MTITSTDDDLGVDPGRTSTDLLPVADVVRSTALVPRRQTSTSPPPPPPAVAGAGLIVEAELAIHERRWRDALRILDAINAIEATSVHTDGLVAIAATHLHRTRRAKEAIGRIRASTQTAATHRSLAAIAVARHEFLTADTELRAGIDQAIEEGESVSTEDWAHLAAIYAGLGWFDDAEECFERIDAEDLTDQHRWTVGRSVNHWAMSRTWAIAVAGILFYPLGLLAVAVGMTVPFMVREFRLTRIDGNMASLASSAWEDERWLRIAHASGVLTTVVLWSLAIQLY